MGCRDSKQLLSGINQLQRSGCQQQRDRISDACQHALCTERLQAQTAEGQKKVSKLGQVLLSEQSRAKLHKAQSTAVCTCLNPADLLPEMVDVVPTCKHMAMQGQWSNRAVRIVKDVTKKDAAQHVMQLSYLHVPAVHAL